METRSEKKTENQFRHDYIPCGAWILVEKDSPPKQVGKILIPDRVREKTTNWTSTGLIVSKSPWKKLQDEWEDYVYPLYRVGDRIGFSATVPLMAPMPPCYIFEKEKTDDARYITLHITDVLCILCETEEKRAEFLGRF